MISLKFRQGRRDVVELLKDFGQSMIVTMQVKKNKWVQQPVAMIDWEHGGFYVIISHFLYPFVLSARMHMSR